MSATPESLNAILSTRMKEIPRIEHEELLSNNNVRKREVDNMYALFTEIMSKPVTLQWDEFQRFLPLFKGDKRFTINPMNIEEVGPYYELSMEFVRRVNPYKEFQVIFPDGQEPITFPPIFTPVGQLKPEHTKAIDIFQNINIKCPDQPWKIKAATNNLVRALMESQENAVISYQTKKFEQQADLFQSRMHHETTHATKEPEDTDGVSFRFE